jgi:hypothetical protein
MENSQESFTVQYDSLKVETATVYVVVFDGREVPISKAISEIDEKDKTIEIPMWLIERENLEDFII